MGPFAKQDLFPRLEKKGVRMKVDTRVIEVTYDGVRADFGGKIVEFDTDSVIIAAGFASNRELIEELEGDGTVFHAIGDCVEPRRIQNAISNGTGLNLQLAHIMG